MAELSRKVRLNYQMAFRGPAGDFIVPSVVHWKVGDYAAMLRQDGDKYQLQDNAVLGSTNWTAIPGDVTTLSNLCSKLDPLTPSNRFYRVLP